MTTSYPGLSTHAREDAARPDLWEALREVMDPEMPISVVDLGLIVSLAAEAGCVELELTFTAMGCPAMEMLMDDIRARLLLEPGIREVHIEVVWEPIWSKERLTTDGIEIMRLWG